MITAINWKKIIIQRFRVGALQYEVHIEVTSEMCKDYNYHVMVNGFLYSSIPKGEIIYSNVEGSWG